MQYVIVILVAALAFGGCYLVDKGFTKLFRSQAQHMSGLSVRLSRRYSVVGLIFFALGVSAIFSGMKQGWILTAAGVFVILVGIALVVYYMTFGVFYDEDGFIYTSFGKRSVTYRFDQIKGQMLYLSGTTIIVELHMEDGRTISIQSTMDGAFPFLDKAFAGWCRQKGIDPESCDFHDPANSLWFPQE